MAPPPGLKLPAKLVDELGGQDALAGGKRPHFARTESRKDQRKAQRIEKKAARSGPPPQKRAKLHHVRENTDHRRQEELRRPPREKPISDNLDDVSRPKPTLKRTQETDPRKPKISQPRAKSPPVRISRAVKDKLAEDDEEIAFLERKLGLKKKKSLPQSFKDDGLDELLEGLADEEGSDGERAGAGAESGEWLNRKRREARSRMQGTETIDMELKDDSGEEHEDELDELNDGTSDEAQSYDSEGEELDSDDNFDGFGSQEEETLAPKVRENPYVAPVVGDAPPKYIPPSLRKPSSSESEQLVHLRRQLQGLVNRLTESNLISILGDIENIYRTNARHHVTSILVEILLTSICEPTSLPDTLIILPAGFVASIFKIIGTDFGAELVQQAVKLFNEHYSRAIEASTKGSMAATSDSTKETSNLIMLLSEMYNFQVVGGNLIFDYIRLFLKKLSELNAELLLKIIRTSGPQLRQDDPSSLKEIVALLRPAVAEAGEENISVRTKFMIETINDLKNNRMKTGGASSAITSEHTIRMKKILGSLHTRSIKGSEPLRMGLVDFQKADKHGKWWLVGASWSGPADDRKADSSARSSSDSRGDAHESGISDLAQLAKEQRMNTEVRRAIFVAIMSASDCQDAYLRLMKLQLKKKQEYEIPRVLLHCVGAEKGYNPYYTLIAKRLCGDLKLKKSFQFSLWDLFDKLAESQEHNENDTDESLDMRHVVNLAKMFGSLIADGGLTFGVLKNLNMSYLQPKTRGFVEVLFITAFIQSQRLSDATRDEQTIVDLITKIKDEKELAQGLQYFLKKVVSRTDIAGGASEHATVRWACKVAINTLARLAALEATKE